MAAAIKGRHRIVSYLLQAGADPLIRGTHKDYDCYDTALGWATRLGQKKVVAQMEEYDAYTKAVQAAKKTQLVVGLAHRAGRSGQRPLCTTPSHPNPARPDMSLAHQRSPVHQTTHGHTIHGEATVTAVEF